MRLVRSCPLRNSRYSPGFCTAGLPRLETYSKILSAVSTELIHFSHIAVLFTKTMSSAAIDHCPARLLDSGLFAGDLWLVSLCQTSLVGISNLLKLARDVRTMEYGCSVFGSRSARITCESPRLETINSPCVRLMQHIATVDPENAGSEVSLLNRSNRIRSSSASAALIAPAQSSRSNSGRWATRWCRL
jgi:hypothetical protein